MKKIFSCALISFTIFSMLSCGDNTKKNTNSSTEKSKDVSEVYKKMSPEFNEQNAYNNIATQVKFGPRVPGTEAHAQTAQWLESELQKYSENVVVQKTKLTVGDQVTRVPCYNIFAQFNPAATHRILLLAHWDTRPWADNDFKERENPIDGADDGGSGVGVLLEIARVLKDHKISDSVGVDILLVDVEDYGKSEWGNDSYALGSQYFSKNPIIPGYKAQAGILLDMVGGKNANFAMEGFSMQYASGLLNEIWNYAQKLGYGKFFVYERGNAITDDHVPINRNLGIPTIDIINLPPTSSTGFVGHWHTHDDKIENIDPATLKAVGQTVLEYIYTR